MLKQVYECTECGNKSVVDPKEGPPETCWHCEEVGESKESIVTPQQIIKILIEQLTIYHGCPKKLNKKITCNKGCLKFNHKIETCWIAWAEEKAKNGT